MAVVQKTLGQTAPLATTNTDLYTVPASTNTVCSSIVVCNRSNQKASFRIAVRPLGAVISNEHYIYFDVLIDGNNTFISTIGITLEATDVVTVYAGNSNLSFSLFGQENS